MASSIVKQYTFSNIHHFTNRLAMKISTPSLTIIIRVLTGIFLIQFSGLLYADETEQSVNRQCTRQSIITIAKIRNSMDTELTEHDIHMIRLGAMNACLDTYNRLVKIGKSVNTEQNITSRTENDVQESSDDKIVNKEKKSLLDRILSTESKDTVNPMQKKHSTGGK